ncbi:ribokinase [Salimicrobium flavidum]|uniref:Ribokinase n=1 Tax=Salimicrobium flavidum TaxID=570947 RepID=A0A1N7IRZ7_9BACI|nr:ribokinase [Salimicrobium flavidum]SIS39797.1 ribokinase [Salimicrobium flavidum]
MRKPKVTVVGSINMDLVVSASRMPEKGETLMGDDFHTYPGGKGANQAVAATRAGADVTLIGAVGVDSFGQELMTHLEKQKVNMSLVTRKKDVPTGIATIILAENDNRIIVTPGANHSLTPEDIKKQEETIRNSDIVLFQLETPVEVVIKAAELAHQAGVKTILNPAPFQPIPEELFETIKYFTPNETEVKELTSGGMDGRLQKKLIVTMGEQGVSYTQDEQSKHVAAYKVNAIDTTGAGDTFNGSLAAKLASGSELNEAIDFANASAALSVEKAGAQNGMPEKEEVEKYLQGVRGNLK